MLRFPTMSLAALAIFALPLAGVAESQIPETDSEAVILAAVEDAAPVAPVRIAKPRGEDEAATQTKRSARGSNQSMAGFRFSDAYAFPQQTLPVNFPSLPTFGF